MLFGNRIRELRDKQGVLQRQLAALLEIDTPMFSKIERGDRRAKCEHVIKLAEYLHQDGGRKINCVMRRFFPSSSVGDRPAPRGCTSTPDERKVTTI